MFTLCQLVGRCTCGYSKAAPFNWRLVEQGFHNDNRLSWWLSHLSSPLD